MANFVAIETEARVRAGTGGARATRRDGKLPGIIYGAKQEPTMIAVDPRSVLKELVRGGWRSRLYELTLDGQKTRALMRDVQFHPLTDAPRHVDFQRLAPGETIRVAVPVTFENELTSPGLKRGGMLNVVRHAVEVMADPDNIPEMFHADLGGLEINDNIRYSDLRGTESVKPVVTDRDFVICTVASANKMPDAPADAAAAAPAAAPAKGKAGAKPAAAAAKPAAAKPAAKSAKK